MYSNNNKKNINSKNFRLAHILGGAQDFFFFFKLIFFVTTNDIFLKFWAPLSVVPLLQTNLIKKDYICMRSRLEK